MIREYVDEKGTLWFWWELSEELFEGEVSEDTVPYFPLDLDFTAGGE